MNSFNNYIKKAEFLKPLVKADYIDLDGRCAYREYFLNWDMEYNPIRKEVIEELEAEQPMRYLAAPSSDNLHVHSDRIQDFLLPSLASLVKVRTEKGDLPLHLSEPLTDPVLEFMRKVECIPVEYFLERTTPKATESHALLSFGFWLVIVGHPDRSAEEVFEGDIITEDVNAHLSVKGFIAAENELGFREFNEEEVAYIKSQVPKV